MKGWESSEDKGEEMRQVWTKTEKNWKGGRKARFINGGR